MLKKMTIISWKSAFVSAFFQALSAVIIGIIYSDIVAVLTGGQEFVGKVTYQKELRGIRHDVVLAICGIVSGAIPILLLRYKHIKHLIAYVFSVFLFYFAFVFCVVAYIDDVVYNIFDYITNALTAVPIGLLVGIVIAVIFKRKKR